MDFQFFCGGLLLHLCEQYQISRINSMIHQNNIIFINSEDHFTIRSKNLLLSLYSFCQRRPCSSYSECCLWLVWISLFYPFYLLPSWRTSCSEGWSEWFSFRWISFPSNPHRLPCWPPQKLYLFQGIHQAMLILYLCHECCNSFPVIFRKDHLLQNSALTQIAPCVSASSVFFLVWSNKSQKRKLKGLESWWFQE